MAAAVTASMAGGTTVEELVRSIVEPQVRAWLEQNLDGLLRDMLREKLNNVFR
jgi:cell pole-organizing protein PopZ